MQESLSSDGGHTLESELVTDPLPQPAERRGLKKHRDFRTLWLGDTVSQLGTQVSVLAVPLTAGAWVDRVRRRPVMIAGDLVRFAVLLSVPAAAWGHVLTIWQLCAVVLV